MICASCGTKFCYLCGEYGAYYECADRVYWIMRIHIPIFRWIILEQVLLVEESCFGLRLSWVMMMMTMTFNYYG
jgi:hypothetical protein